MDIPTPFELFGVEVGKGWWPLVEPIYNRIQELNEADANIEITQIKEKWGELCFYVSGAPDEIYDMIREAEKYLGYPYVWGGSSPSTSFDCSGFVSWVINNCGNGWNYGRLGAEGLRQVCAYVPASEARPGDLIFFQGTYDTSGASHVGIYVGNGMMIHCGNPIQYTSINTTYWQNHFYQFGRIR